MLIAVSKYRDRKLSLNYDLYGTEKVAIFDTDDCTTEAVLPLGISDAVENGVNIRNLVITDKKIILVSSYYDFSRVPHGTYVHVIRQNRRQNADSTKVYVGDTIIQLNEDWHKKCLEVNGVRVINEIVFNISYLFKAFGYIIIRMNNRHKEGGGYGCNWFTVAYSDTKGLKYWSEDYKITNDKAFAIEVDMLSEV